MGKYNAEEVFELLTYLLIEHLDDLKDVMDTPNEQFAYGEKTAYVEIAEIIQFCGEAEKYGLNFEIEDKYPLL